jgi:hypothetical protein
MWSIRPSRRGGLVVCSQCHCDAGPANIRSDASDLCPADRLVRNSRTATRARRRGGKLRHRMVLARCAPRAIIVQGAWRCGRTEFQSRQNGLVSQTTLKRRKSFCDSTLVTGTTLRNLDGYGWLGRGRSFAGVRKTFCLSADVPPPHRTRRRQTGSRAVLPG